MREIEFRGKEIYTGKWFYGSLIDLGEDGAFIVLDERERYEVYPETIGQYTGLKDKNGKNIFEGDIVKNGLSGTWIISPLENGAFSLLGADKKYKDSCYFICALNYEAKVIGNIHDNPEMLEWINA